MSTHHGHCGNLSATKIHANVIPHRRRGTTAKGCNRNSGLGKLLLHVTVERCAGAVHLVMADNDTVADLVAATVEAYTRERRRPLLRGKDPDCFQLHYSPFCLESLEPDEDLINLGSRNFFLYSKPTTSINSCSEKATQANQPPSSMASFIDFLL